MYAAGVTVDEAIFNQIASVIDNVSATYNMGLTVNVTPYQQARWKLKRFPVRSTRRARSPFGWGDDYPWVMDFLAVMYAQGAVYAGGARRSIQH